MRITLKRGLFDPLSLMTFKVLPAKYLKDADDRSFAQEPIGSGPYQYLGIKKGNRGDYSQFLANPTYGRRAGKQELPRMPAIHFYETRVKLPGNDLRERDLVTEFKSGDMQLLLDLPGNDDINLAAWLKKLSDDPDSAVRAGAARVAVERDVDFAERLEQMSRSDPDGTVRKIAEHYRKRYR